MSSTSLGFLRLPISSTYIGVMRQFFTQIPRMDLILMRHWMLGHVIYISSSVIYKNK